jgi:S1-C subfamily serine protease
MRYLWPCLLVLALPGAAGANVDLDALQSSVVQVEVTVQDEDYASPWQRPDPTGSGGSAFFIGDGRLMTNAHVVSNARIIRLKRPDRPERYDARVLFIAHDCDLALLTVDDPTFFDGMKPLAIGGIPALRSQVTAVGYPVGGRKLSITEGVVSRIELNDYVHTGADRHLTIQVDAAINPGNSGGAVIQNDLVVGVAFQTQFFSQNIGYMIPTPVVRHFLKDIEDGTYDGYPMLGVRTGNLENAALREYLGVPEGETGVVILKALPFSSTAGILERNDVLHAVDGVPVENDGTVKVEGEYLELLFVVQEKHVGDTINLKIRRRGEVMDIPVKLGKWDVRMPDGAEYEVRPEYLVLGGHVFVPLSSGYVGAAGWRSDLGYWLNEFYTSLIDDRPGVEQLVVLSRTLQHDSTRYQDYGNVVVRTVNDKAPRDFRHFVELLDGAEQAVIEFEGVNVEPLLLDRAKIAKVQKAILETYGIKEDRYLREEKR